MTYTPRMQPNLMGRTNGHQVMTLGPNDSDWQERGEFASTDSWSHACSSKNTWERRGHKVRVYEIDLMGGKVVYETA